MTPAQLRVRLAEIAAEPDLLVRDAVVPDEVAANAVAGNASGPGAGVPGAGALNVGAPGAGAPGAGAPNGGAPAAPGAGALHGAAPGAGAPIVVAPVGGARNAIERDAAAIRDDFSATLGTPPVAAAVLVPVVMGETPGILLTKRTSHLSAHAGQVSFPGGRIDPADRGPEAAALREAWEEIGIAPDVVQVLGRMADQMTSTGYRITPVLGLLPPGLAYRPSAYEVEAVFELPISVLLDPDAPKRQRHHVRGVWREYWVWPHADHYIWGATAAILVRLAELLRERNV